MFYLFNLSAAIKINFLGIVIIQAFGLCCIVVCVRVCAAFILIPASMCLLFVVCEMKM